MVTRKIKNLKDANGEKFYPVTHKDAIVGLSAVEEALTLNTF